MAGGKALQILNSLDAALPLMSDTAASSCAGMALRQLKAQAVN